jgi:polysaccharide export outer membrane protein
MLLPALLPACAGVPDPVPVAAAPGPAPAGSEPAPYRVQRGDVLSVRLYTAPELNEDVTVRPDGRLTTTLAEAVPALGRTPEQVAAALRPIYARELKDPRLTVEVKSFAPCRVFVAGEVASPGEFVSAEPDLTLVQAVARAGGLRPSGDSDRVMILRRGPGDVPRLVRTDYAAAVSGRDPAADQRLQPYDVVYVPKTGAARAYAWFNQHVQQFLPVSWGFSYNVNPVVNNTR